MPYIAIKFYPKDEETKKRVVEKINQLFLDEWGCPPQALTISIEEIAPADWQEQVVKTEIVPKAQYMMIQNGEKKF